MPGFKPAAQTTDIAEGRIKVVEVGDTRVLLCKVQGRICAIADVCTHDGGPLGDGDLDGFEIICPRHGARFDVRTGAVLAFPAITPVDAYPVKIEGDSVLVDVDAPIGEEMR